MNIGIVFSDPKIYYLLFCNGIYHFLCVCVFLSVSFTYYFSVIKFIDVTLVNKTMYLSSV